MTKSRRAMQMLSRWSLALLAVALGGAATLLAVITLTARHTYGDIERASARQPQS